jgi:hypothetical protein
VEKMILALDTATVTGWAAGNPGDEPTWGSRDFTSPGGNGEVIAKFRHSLNGLCYKFKPTTIVFESPYIPRPNFNRRPGAGPPPMNALTLRRLLTLTGIVEEVAWELRIECLEATAAEIMKFFLGTGRVAGGRPAKKAATIAMCQRYGWATVDEDACDALALWTMAEGIIDPRAASRRGDGPLFIAPRPRSSGVKLGGKSG